MARGSFKPDKPAKVTGGNASTFNAAISEIKSKGEISDSAKADAWGIHVNKIDWEHPYDAINNPDGPHD